mgnify:CR=1 FL=1
MAPKDREKTTFTTQWGTYCYRVMLFGLKNAGDTYQRAATTILHDMIHKEIEVYVDAMIVKSKERESHYTALKFFFPTDQRILVAIESLEMYFWCHSKETAGVLDYTKGHPNRSFQNQGHTRNATAKD